MKTVCGVTCTDEVSVASEARILDITLFSLREARCGDDRMRSQHVEQGKLLSNGSCCGPAVCDYPSLSEMMAEAGYVVPPSEATQSSDFYAMRFIKLMFCWLPVSRAYCVTRDLSERLLQLFRPLLTVEHRSMTDDFRGHLAAALSSYKLEVARSPFGLESMDAVHAAMGKPRAERHQLPMLVTYPDNEKVLEIRGEPDHPSFVCEFHTKNDAYFTQQVLSQEIYFAHGVKIDPALFELEGLHTAPVSSQRKLPLSRDFKTTRAANSLLSKGASKSQWRHGEHGSPMLTVWNRPHLKLFGVLRHCHPQIKSLVDSVKNQKVVLWGAFGYGMLIALRQLGFGAHAKVEMVDPFFSEFDEDHHGEGGHYSTRWDRSKARLVDRVGLNFDNCRKRPFPPQSYDLWAFTGRCSAV